MKNYDYFKLSHGNSQVTGLSLKLTNPFFYCSNFTIMLPLRQELWLVQRIETRGMHQSCTRHLAL